MDKLEQTLAEIGELFSAIQAEVLKIENKKVTIRARKAVQKDLKGKMGNDESNVYTL